MGKNKKIKKTIKKKVVKKQIKKNQNKKPQEERRMTPDQQSKQLEFLKTALSRPGAQGGGGDPQYRDLTQKVQQLTEENNQKNAALIEMRNRYESGQQMKKQLNQEEQNIKRMEKDNKRNEEVQKRRQALDDKKDDIQYQKDIMEGNNEIGKMNEEERQLDYENKKLKREKEKQDQQIAKNTAYNNLELKRKENEDIQNRINFNNQIIESEDYKKANEKWAEEERKNYILRMELRNSQEALKQKEEIDAERRRIENEEWKRNEYKRARRQRQKVDSEGRPVFEMVKNEKGKLVYKTDDHGNFIKVMEDDPTSSWEYEDKVRARNSIRKKEENAQIIRQLQAEDNKRNRFRDNIEKVQGDIMIQKSEIEALEQHNMIEHGKNTNIMLSKEYQNNLMEKAKNEADLNFKKKEAEQLEETRKINEKNQYLKLQEDLMKTPEYIQQQEHLARAQMEIDLKNKENDVLKNGIKAQQAAAEQQARINTLNLFEKTGKEINPETIGQVVAQVNQEGLNNMNENINKTISVNKINDFQNKFKEKYGDYGKPIFEGVLERRGITFNDNTPLDTLNKAANILDYTYNNFGYFDEDPEEAFNTFTNSEGFQKL